MTSDEHDNPAASAAREATELYPFSSGYPEQTGPARGPLPDWQSPDQPLPDLPVLEQLPDPDALPDPGYPAMPATPPPAASQPPPARPPWPVAVIDASSLRAVRAATTPACQSPRSARRDTGHHCAGRHPARRCRRLPPSFRARHVRRIPSAARRGTSGVPATRAAAPETRTALTRRQRPLDVQTGWTPDPYTAPRPPEAAPPLRGPSVPWSQVRVGNDVASAAEPGRAQAVAPPSPFPSRRRCGRPPGAPRRRRRCAAA